MNPYAPPSYPELSTANLQSKNHRPAFRYRMIPMTLCYTTGGLLLLTIPIGVYLNFNSLSIDSDAATPFFLLDILFVCSPLILAFAAGSLLFAGKCWYRAKWWSACGFTLIAIFAIQFIALSADYLRKWGGEIY